MTQRSKTPGMVTRPGYPVPYQKECPITIHKTMVNRTIHYDLAMAEQILDAAGYAKDYDLDGTMYRFNGTTITTLL